MSNKLPKFSSNLYLKLAQALSHSETRLARNIEMTEEEIRVNSRYYEAFMNGQKKALEEQQDDENAA